MCDKHNHIMIPEKANNRFMKKEIDNELTEEQLAIVSGGSSDPNEPLHCPKCGSTNIIKGHVSTMDLHLCECKDCGHRFFVEKD